MADRSVNININYKVNSVEVDKSAASVKRAETATEQLRRSTANFNQQSAQGYKFSSKMIEGMEIELARLKQQIKLVSIEDTKRLSQLSAQYKQAKTQLDAYKKSLLDTNQATKHATVQTRDLATTFRDVYNTARLLIAAGLAREMVNISLAAAKLAGNVEAVGRAFKNQIAGSDSLLLRLREATHGAVTDLDLMQQTLQAQNFGIDVQRLPELLEFAAIRAQQTGQSVDYLVNSIVLGIGRKSILILDNLGISANRLKQEFDGASVKAKTVGEVTRGVANIASEEMRKMGGFIETSATAVDELKTAWHELKVEMSTMATEGGAGGFIGMLKSYVDSFTALFQAMNRGIKVEEVFEERNRKMIASISVSEFEQRALNKTKEENIKILEDEIDRLTKSVGAWGNFRNTNESVIESLRKEKIALNEQVKAHQISSFEASKRMVQIEEEIGLRRKMTDANKEDVLIDQEILRLLQSRLQAIKQVRKEEAEIEEGKLVTDLVRLFDPGKTPPKGIEKAAKDALKQQLVDVQKLLQEAARNIPPVVVTVPVTIRPLDGWDKLAQEFAENWQTIVSEGIMNTTDIINATVQAEADSYHQRIAQTEEFYNEQIRLAGEAEKNKTAFEAATQRRTMELEEEKEKKISELRRKAFEAEKEAKRLQTVINGAAGIINAFATLPYPAAIVASLLIAGQTTAQLAVINKQQFRGYAKGEVDIKGGTPGKDSIPAMIMPGESVITTDKTKQSKQTLKLIHAGKLNDKVMSDIVSGRSGGAAVAGVFDDSKIVQKLDEIKNAQPDLVQRGNLIYEVRKKSDTYRQVIRSKTMSR